MTANVDFTYLKEAILSSPIPGNHDEVRIRTHGPVSQASFLNNMGLLARVEALASSTDMERNKRIKGGAERLTSLTGMGKEYAVMGVTCDGDALGEGGGEIVDRDVWPFVDEIE